MTGVHGEGIGSFVLGSVQFGLDYGITNTHGRISAAETARILDAAAQVGVRQIDTAQAYGDSEAALGAVLRATPALHFRVVTKLSPLGELAADTAAAQVIARVDASLDDSQARLGRAPLDAVLLHRAAHLAAWNGIVWARLREMQHDGRVRTLGVSVQNADELAQALDTEGVALIQLPCNVLDGRWQALLDRVRAARRERGLEIHARSALLQGLLTSDKPAHWARAHVTDSAPIVGWLRGCAERHASGKVARLCLGYMRSQDWIDGVVIGVATLAQFEENAAFFGLPRLAGAVLHDIEATRPRLSDRTLDPAQWRPMQ